MYKAKIKLACDMEFECLFDTLEKATKYTEDIIFCLWTNRENIKIKPIKHGIKYEAIKWNKEDKELARIKKV